MHADIFDPGFAEHNHLRLRRQSQCGQLKLASGNDDDLGFSGLKPFPFKVANPGWLQFTLSRTDAGHS